jgi:predicted small lipoprotein YifL
MDRENGRGHRGDALLAGILALSGALLVSACGQRGPLYLPKPPAEPPARSAAQPLPAPVPAAPVPAAPAPAGTAPPDDSSTPRRTR